MHCDSVESVSGSGAEVFGRADMALIWASYMGDKWNKHLDDEYLCTFETADQQLFYFNGHIGGVMGVQIAGAPEAGKSFLTNYVTGQTQKYKPMTMILDIGHRYQDLTAECEGSSRGAMTAAQIETVDT